MVITRLSSPRRTSDTYALSYHALSITLLILFWLLGGTKDRLPSKVVRVPQVKSSLRVQGRHGTITHWKRESCILSTLYETSIKAYGTTVKNPKLYYPKSMSFYSLIPTSHRKTVNKDEFPLSGKGLRYLQCTIPVELVKLKNVIVAPQVPTKTVKRNDECFVCV